MSTTTPPDGPTQAWRRAHFSSLADLAAVAVRDDGAAWWLDDAGHPVTDRAVETWITCRMAHVLGMAHLLGCPGAGDHADRALSGLRSVLADAEHGGWLASRGPGAEDVDGTKEAYAHAFVVLAAATGTMAGRAGAPELLAQALRVLDERFWEAEHGLHLDTRSRDWSVVDPYRGVNANMHGVEALLAAHDATGEQEWLARAAGIADRVVTWAEANSWRIPEHFGTDWRPELEYNADRPNDPFKPYGATPGHGLEWARLLVQVDVAAQTPGQRTVSAQALFDRAVQDGWDPDGGFVYTTDWSGEPVEARRFHWVAAEAVAAADVLGQVTGQARYGELAGGWWEWIDAHLIDHLQGSWFHELDTENNPSGRTWVGKPDVYHAAQATILPLLPLTGSFGASARAAGPVLAPAAGVAPVANGAP
ncbi:AGE family epimerase/isomerase [Isoptericola sp. NEAU-Y5]|uniref:AGE family epimerase/isomerase n=1 Tax=Isoptericola luteus TaxID=2879484 RepID=A0ABS7ZIU9_9MICO|nr:AGE family epimerase/isomerase [Isoptericola sp. NEAU-Y5]MCA5894246.1 AGE family epimerase/isomerase [Isoptericola sp. NEAU-Y5]